MPENTAETGSLSFEALLSDGGAAASSFTTAFRGYDKDEVDAAIARLGDSLRAAADESAERRDANHRSEAALAAARTRIDELERRAQDADGARDAAVEAARAESAAETARLGDRVAQLTADLAAAHAQTMEAHKQVKALSDELSGEGAASPNRQHFEEILRVAEEQASTLIRNASVQGDRLLQAARDEIDQSRKGAQVDAEALRSQAQHDADQIRLRIQTEQTAHEAQMERESAHSAEKIAQAEREAAAIRSEAEKGAATLRSMVARETGRDRAEAEEANRELRMRTLEFEESLTRRQDDAHQEFLVLHNQAVAHAERITTDANEQVAASLEHAQRVAAKADDYDRLARAQARQIEADARVRAGAVLEQARERAQKIMDLVTTNAHSVLHSAEDRTRQLRWQQHQLLSFMAEVKELIRPAEVAGDEISDADDGSDADGADVADAARDVGAVDAVDAVDVADAGRDVDAVDAEGVANAGRDVDAVDAKDVMDLDTARTLAAPLDAD